MDSHNLCISCPVFIFIHKKTLRQMSQGQTPLMNYLMTPNTFSNTTSIKNGTITQICILSHFVIFYRIHYYFGWHIYLTQCWYLIPVEPPLFSNRSPSHITPPLDAIKPYAFSFFIVSLNYAMLNFTNMRNGCVNAKDVMKKTRSFLPDRVLVMSFYITWKMSSLLAYRLPCSFWGPSGAKLQYFQ